MVDRNFNLKIEKDIPLPQSKTHPTPYETGTARWLAKQMKPGDSVVVPTSGRATSLATAIRREYQREPGRQVVVIRQIGDNQFRVWRKK